MLVQWDDHEVLQQLVPGHRPRRRRSTPRRASTCWPRAPSGRCSSTCRSARIPARPERVYRAYRYGPLARRVRPDERSYRRPNNANRQAAQGADNADPGRRAARTGSSSGCSASPAAWKVIATDMPLGLVVGDGQRDGSRLRGGGPTATGRAARPRARDRGAAARSSSDHRIRNVVWLTADVHYAAAHHYDPARAAFKDFLPFWEFVAGPLHAGTFGPSKPDSDLWLPAGLQQRAARASSPIVRPATGCNSSGR